MAWRRRRAGRPRKFAQPRHPGGQLKRAAPTPPPVEVQRRRLALFGSMAVQAETDWVIDQLWGMRVLNDRERAAALRLNALHRGFLARAGGPACRGQPFHDAGGSGLPPSDDAADWDHLEAEHKAAAAAVRRLDVTGRCLRVTMDSVAHQVWPTEATMPLLRVGLEAAAAHFARPQKLRLAGLLGGLDGRRER